MKWVDNHIEVDPPKRPKKVTATKFAAILGLNKWSTPFEQFCEITRTYNKPYEDTIYTIAGKTIEPKQIQYMRDSYLMTNLRDPHDIYGADPFKTTYGDFFHDTKVFGGMWDSLLVDENENPTTVLEFKTTKRAEDWAEDIPEYYAMQAALYAYLLGVDDVIMIASFLQPSDYDHPDKFVPSVENTITRDFKVSERYPNFDEMIQTALDWWNNHIVTGVSPDYDEVKDAEILKVLRTNNPQTSDDVSETIAQAEKLKAKLDEAKESIGSMESEYKKLTESIKEFAMKQFRDGDTQVDLSGNHYTFSLSRTEGSELNKKALKADGLLEKYIVPKTSYRLTVKQKEEQE